jgi:hypothetical protein
MTSLECFTDWAWGHIEDVYSDREVALFSSTKNLSILNFISKCAQEALCDLDLEEQEEMFGFTLEEVAKGDLLDRFYSSEILKEYP